VEHWQSDANLLLTLSTVLFLLVINVFVEVYVAITNHSATVYPICTHWIWDTNGGGWLATYGWHTSGSMVDFAGSGSVHLLGGTTAFIGAACLGARRGRFATSNKDKAYDLKGHSVPVTISIIFSYSYIKTI
jgi:ammonia channel protein AmtB